MSIPLRIAATFDGTTITTLENAVNVPEERLFELVVPLAGLIRPWTFKPVGARDLFLQAVSVRGVPAGGSATLELVFPSGEALPVPMVLAGDQAVVMNVIVPQGALVSLAVKDAAGAPVPAVVEIWIYGVNDKTYAQLGCCHFFAPEQASELAVQDEGVLISDPTAFMNFVGAGVTAVANGDGVDVTIPGGIVVKPDLGGISCDNGAPLIATVIAAPGAFVPVGTGNPGTHPLYVLDAFVNNFAIAGATAPTQTLVYGGPAPRDIVITPTMNVITGVLGGILVHMRVLKNGVPIGPLLVGNTAGLLFSSVTVTGEIHDTATLGDVYQLEVANLSNAANVIVDFAQLSIEGKVA